MAKKSALDDLKPAERKRFAGRIREMVDAAGSQNAAADAAGVSVRQIAAYCAGESAPTFLPLAKLAGHTGFSLEWVYSGKGPRRRSDLTVEQMTAPSASPLMRVELSLKEAQLQHDLVVRLQEVYAEAGITMSEATSDAVIGAAVDLLINSTLGLDHWQELSDVIVASHGLALSAMSGKRRQGKNG
jgi:transcriptional regulator with XRE-family HTH domain